MQLSKHFTLEEFTHSDTALKLGIDNSPNEEQTEKLKTLCEFVLERIREFFGLPVHIDSGFRSEALNDAVPNSSKTSQHSLGEAADITIPGLDLVHIIRYIVAVLEYDQVILEPTWVHVSFRAGKNRKQALKAFPHNGEMNYIPWSENET
jgi:zinc D-Ala-D-Ala carboxypeptidase